MWAVAVPSVSILEPVAVKLHIKITPNTAETKCNAGCSVSNGVIATTGVVNIESTCVGMFNTGTYVTLKR